MNVDLVYPMLALYHDLSNRKGWSGDLERTLLLE